MNYDNQKNELRCGIDPDLNIAPEYDRFRLLVDHYASTSTGIRRPITMANVPARYEPKPLLPRTYRQLASERYDINPSTDTALNEHVFSSMPCIDTPHPVVQKTQYNKLNKRSRAYETAEKLLTDYSLQHKSDAYSFPGVPQETERTCMKCWTALGRLLCHQCSSYFCGPCVVATHQDDAYKTHRITAVTKQRSETSDSATSFNEYIRSQKALSKQKVTFLSPTPASLPVRNSHHGSADKVIGFRPLPDPDHHLPAVSKKVRQQLTQPTEAYCSIHTDELLVIACKTCRFLPLCNKCCASSLDPDTVKRGRTHDGHEFISFEEAADIITKDVDKLRSRTRQELQWLRRAEQSFLAVQRSRPVLLRGVEAEINSAYHKFFQGLSAKYSEVHSRLIAVQENVAKRIKDLATDATSFRLYLEKLKLPQIEALIRLGNREPSAGLNGYVTLLPSLRPLVQDVPAEGFLLDNPHPIFTPWWNLNTPDIRKLFLDTENKTEAECATVATWVNWINAHVQRYLQPVEIVKMHPAPQEKFKKEKTTIYGEHQALPDIEPLRIPPYGAVPHTPEFNKLLPQLEGWMYRKDPFNDWSVVCVSLVDTYLVIGPREFFQPQSQSGNGKDVDVEHSNDEAREKPTSSFCIESAVPLLSTHLSITRFSSPDISNLTRRELERAKNIHRLNVVDGLEIIARCSSYGKRYTATPGTTQKEPLIVTGYWLLGSDTEGAVQLWADEIDQLRASLPSLPRDYRVPVLHPGLLPPQAGVRHPPLAASHKFAAVQAFGFPSSAAKLEYDSKEPEPKAAVERGPTSELEPEGPLELEPEGASELEPERALELQSKAVLEFEPKAVLEFEPKAVLEFEPKAVLEFEPKVALEPEPETGMGLEPKTASELEPKSALKLEPKTASELEPKSALKLEPKTALEMALDEAETAAKEVTQNALSKNEERRHTPLKTYAENKSWAASKNDEEQIPDFVNISRNEEISMTPLQSIMTSSSEEGVADEQFAVRKAPVVEDAPTVSAAFSKSISSETLTEPELTDQQSSKFSDRVETLLPGAESAVSFGEHKAGVADVKTKAISETKCVFDSAFIAQYFSRIEDTHIQESSNSKVFKTVQDTDIRVISTTQTTVDDAETDFSSSAISGDNLTIGDVQPPFLSRYQSKELGALDIYKHQPNILLEQLTFVPFPNPFCDLDTELSIVAKHGNYSKTSKRYGKSSFLRCSSRKKNMKRYSTPEKEHRKQHSTTTVVDSAEQNVVIDTAVTGRSNISNCCKPSALGSNTLPVVADDTNKASATFDTDDLRTETKQLISTAAHIGDQSSGEAIQNIVQGLNEVKLKIQHPYLGSFLSIANVKLGS